MRLVTDLSKGVLGQADSVVMWGDIISHIPDSVLLKPNVRILCVACGHGTTAIVLAKRMLALGISKEAVNDSLILLDKYIHFTNFVKSKGFKNVITADFLTWKTDMKFDVVVGNPPYQDGTRDDQANKLWPLFVNKSYKLLNNNGYIAMITPNGWMQPTADIGKGTGVNALSIFNDIFKENNLILANIDSELIREKYFKGVGSTFSYYVMQKCLYSGTTEFITSTGSIYVDISTINSLPKITSKESLSVVKKMVGKPFLFVDQNHGLGGLENAEAGTYNAEKKNKNGSISKNTTYTHKIYHTNKDGGTYWHSEKLNPYATKPKVIISLSGTYLPVYDNTAGFSNMCLALICSTDSEAVRAQTILSSKLFRFWVEMQKFSGFNPRKLILTLPKVDLTRAWTDAELYAHFNLTQEEIDYIEANVK